MLTIKEVQKQAQKSPKAALECSIKHWWENAHLAPEKLINQEPWKSSLCALCARYFNSERYSCGKCPLFTIDDCNDIDSKWEKAQCAHYRYKHNRSDVNFRAWQKAARAMHRELCSLRKKS